MNGDGGDAPPAGALGPDGRLAGVGSAGSFASSLMDAFLSSSGAQEALAFGSAAATGPNASVESAAATGVARPWESVALEGDASAKRFKMDTSGAVYASSTEAVGASSASAALPASLSMALGDGASSASTNPTGNVLQQHLRQQHLEQQQRQRALQAHAQHQRLPFAAAQPPPSTGAALGAAGGGGDLVVHIRPERAGPGGAVFSAQPVAVRPQVSLSGGAPIAEQSAGAAFLSAKVPAFSLPMPRADAAPLQSSQPPPQQSLGSLQQLQKAQPPQSQPQQQPRPQQPQQQSSGAAALAVASSAATTAPPTVAPPSNRPCLVCQQEGGVFSCQGGCGLHAHPACVGEDAIIQSPVGQLCGSCYIMQQDRNVAEDLTKGDVARVSMRRSILWMNLETNNPVNFEKFGHMTSLRLLEIGRATGYPIKPFAEKFAEPFLQRWMREKLAHVDKWQLSVQEVFTLMIGLYGLKCACISHDRLAHVVKLVKARNLSVTDYIGWHPAIESPNVRCSAICPICNIRNTPELEQCARCHRRLQFPSVYMKYVSAILATFYAEQVGIPLGATVNEVFAHTNTVRQAYKGLSPVDADGVPWEIFTDQLRMIFGLLDVMSDFGSLQLNPDLFAPEVAILFNPSYIQRAMLQTDYEILGRMVQCMKLFGGARTEAQGQLVVGCEQFLLLRQMPNGSWCRIGGSSVDQYKATVACTKGLASPKFRGYGPLSADCQRLLEKWAKSFKGSAVGKVAQPHQQSSATATAGGSDADKLLASGAIAKSTTRANLKRLEAMYKQQLVPRKGVNAMEHLVSARMRALVSDKKFAVKAEEEEGERSPTPEDDQLLIKSEGGKADAKDAVKTERPLKAEEEGGGGASEATREHSASGDIKIKHEDDEVLTSRSLSEDLEIFDGLKFEDGDVIDLNHVSLVATVDEDDGEADENVDGDAGTENAVDDDEIGDDMYDDDNEENDDGSGSNHSGDEDQGQPEPVRMGGDADGALLESGEARGDTIEDSSAPLL